MSPASDQAVESSICSAKWTQPRSPTRSEAVGKRTLGPAVTAETPPLKPVAGHHLRRPMVPDRAATSSSTSTASASYRSSTPQHRRLSRSGGGRPDPFRRPRHGHPGASSATRCSNPPTTSSPAATSPPPSPTRHCPSHDPTFANPTKFVGTPPPPRKPSASLPNRDGASNPTGTPGTVVVASPARYRFVEIRLIRQLLAAGIIVVCAGRRREDRILGAVVVHRRAPLDADTFLLVIDAAAIEDHDGIPHARPVSRSTPAEPPNRPFPAGSICPKSTPSAASSN